MDNLKNDAYYLDKIKSDLKFVIDHTSGKTKAEFEKDEVLVDCVMFRIIQIAENCNKLSEAFQAENIKVPWTAVKGMRNRIVHGYGNVDLTIVYDTVINGIPDMYKMILELC